MLFLGLRRVYLVFLRGLRWLHIIWVRNVGLVGVAEYLVELLQCLAVGCRHDVSCARRWVLEDVEDILEACCNEVGIGSGGQWDVVREKLYRVGDAVALCFGGVYLETAVGFECWTDIPSFGCMGCPGSSCVGFLMDKDLAWFLGGRLVCD